jgi:hypothetical protein
VEETLDHKLRQAQLEGLWAEQLKVAAEASKFIAEQAKYQAEASRLGAEQQKFIAEQSKLVSEAMKYANEASKLARETKWLPVVWGTAFLATVVSSGLVAGVVALSKAWH